MSLTLRALGTATVALGLVLGLAPAPAQAAATQAAKTDRAQQVFALPIGEFLAVKRDAQAERHRTAVDRELNYVDDGCSAPTNYGGWSAFFAPSCKRHDFGYRNFGKGLKLDSARRNVGRALISTNEKKGAVDRRFLADMITQCERRSDRDQCRRAAQAFYAGVAGTFGQANTAFHASECHPGRLCVFDDTSYRDRRLMLTAAEDDMRDLGFGDKTSAVKNESDVAWVLYTDTGYRGRSLCVPRRSRVADLASRGFGDRTSSVRRLSRATC